MKKSQFFTLFWIIFSILASELAISQSVRLVRTDVDSTRESFVTATYMFAFDIKIDNLENCNNASFRLKFDNADFVKFSGASIVDFGEEGTLFVYENDLGGDEVMLDIGVFSGQPLQENEFDDPTLVNLEFVVLPTAPDDEVVNFSFDNAFGASFQDGVGQSIPLSAAPVNYNIHGFVQVWPGDSDRDGDVDNIDWTTVYENLKFKERFPGFRSFKRENPTTNYAPQRALVWDVEDATYADCDGDGEISVTDGAVVLLNITEDGGAVRTPANNIEYLDEDKSLNQSLQASCIIVPININPNKAIFGAFGRINISPELMELLIGVEIGDTFYNAANLMIDEKSSGLEFALGSFENGFATNEAGSLINLIFNGDTEISSQDYEIVSLRGITRNKQIINLQNISSVEEVEQDLVIFNQSGQYRIENDIPINSIRIVDIQGKTYLNITPNSNFYILNKSDLPNGFFILQVNGKSYSLVNTNE